MSGSVPVAWTVNVAGLPGTTPFNSSGCWVIVGGSATCRMLGTEKVMKAFHFNTKDNLTNTKVSWFGSLYASTVANNTTIVSFF